MIFNEIYSAYYNAVAKIITEIISGMLIWIIVQRSLRLRQWKADCNCPKQAVSRVDGATVLQIRVCKKCCTL